MTDSNGREIISCETCIYRDLMKTPESKCYNNDDELQFSFCNYQEDKTNDKARNKN